MLEVLSFRLNFRKFRQKLQTSGRGSIQVPVEGFQYIPVKGKELQMKVPAKKGTKVLD